MHRFKRPDVWFLLLLLLIAAAGAVWLAQPGCTQLTEREWRFYQVRHYWRCALDALSATCGAGFLQYDFHQAYTAQGRWALSALGAAGAMLYLLATAHALRRLWSPGTTATPDAERTAADAEIPQTQPRGPSLWLVAGGFLAFQGLSLPLVWGVEQIFGATTDVSNVLWRALAACNSLGWNAGGDTSAARWSFALPALLAALGWPIWFLLPPALRRLIPVRSVLRGFLAYLGILLCAALLIFALETPRGWLNASGAARVETAGGPTLAATPPAERFARGLLQTISASAAGRPTEALSERGVTEGTKAVLAMLLLLGGPSGSSTGGVQCLLLFAALGGLWHVLRGFRRPAAQESPAREPESRLFSAGLFALVSLTGWTVAVAVGLLVLETIVISPFDPPHTFADALLDAASAAGGGNLSSGLLAAVTSENLSSGMSLRVDLYQYGMLWLMLALVVGRVLPLFALVRAAGGRESNMR